MTSTQHDGAGRGAAVSPHAQATVSVRRALAPFAVAGPVLCALVLFLFEAVSASPTSVHDLVGQALGVALVVAANLYASRRIGLRLVGVQADLAEQVGARQAAEHDLRSAVADLTEREGRLQSQQAELTRRNHDLDAVAKATSAVLTGVHARQAVVQAALDISGGLAVLLFEPDPAGQWLTALHVVGLELPEMRVPVDSMGLAATTFRAARTQIIADVATHRGSDQGLLGRFLAAPGGERLRSAVCVPVVHDGRTRAVLVVILGEPIVPGDTRILALLELLAADAALALSREDLTAELARQAVTDPLTGLANRRRWDGELAREAARAARTDRPLSMVMLDLDHFKAYNDTHGHPAGDSLLREATQAWQRLLRADDLLARVGGEEFAVLLVDCDATHAGQVASGLLRAVPQGQTCSAGVAQWNGDTPEQLLARADQALYLAKHRGRDRVHTAVPFTPPTRSGHLHVLPG